MTTMLQTLNETTAAYTFETRAVDAVGHCQYFNDGRCCAVGRCLEHPDEFKDVSMGVNRFNEDYCLEARLKPEYRGFSISFWYDLQSLHDMPCNWDSDGLSERGKKEVSHIKRKFNL